MTIRTTTLVFAFALGLVWYVGGCESNSDGGGQDSSASGGSESSGGSGSSGLNPGDASGVVSGGSGGLTVEDGALSEPGGAIDSGSSGNVDSGSATGGVDGGSAGSGGQAGTISSGGSGGEPEDTSDASIDSSADSEAPTTGCTREELLQVIDDYFQAMAAHDPSSITVAENVKFTENGAVTQLGEGLWKTAGELKFHRDIIDPEQCATITQSVLDDSGSLVIFGLRLKLENLEITEIETMVVRGQSLDAIWFNPQTIIDVKQPEWDEIVPESQRSTRQELEGLAAQYFDLFVDGDLSAYPFTDDCSRYEDGLFTTAAGGCPSFIVATGSSLGTPRYPVTDVERGLTVGIMFYSGMFYDIHMFKVVDGKVSRIHAMMTSQSAGTTGWD